MPSLKIKRGTRAQLDSAAAASGLNQGELYHVTDESRIAVGTAANAYKAMMREDDPVVASQIHAATSKATPVDADELGYLDSASGFGLVRMTWGNLKTWLSGLFVGKTGAQTMAGNLSITKPDTTAARVQTQNTFGSGVSGMGGVNAYEVGSTSSTPVHIYAGGLIRAVVDPTSGNLTMSGGALGYGPGAGGTATQPTSNTTGVALNKPSGQITMSAPMAAGATAVFAVNNSYVTQQSVIALTLGPGLVAAYSVEADMNTGYFRLYVRNVLGAATTAPAVINFAVLAGSVT
ncbi:hypothetical protein AcdelDRAFT_0902 [Acidovorax delafieldii 2AN]|uniref:Major tropism determinant N-terminal domain-containing protein n=1 Tax=Acidovorax delafieldii 2AN TaxID=573060 RepID=C5T1X2_ACIDE|nr:hypothetical protein [Acidovorax delafieldii]EER61567.1 hypothetical protein AcdelDRAFT_0902 [Acidovorax delafieldii 2AN]